MLGAVFRSFLDPGQPLLDERFPLPLTTPFTTRMARAVGLHSSELARLVAHGYLRRLLAGVYVAAPVPDSLALRAAALRLVVPPDAVVTDRTAGWLHGSDMVLAPGDHLVVPPVSMFLNRKGARLRNGLAASGQRTLSVHDVMEVYGVRVTTPLRTACDLGRLLNRDQAFAALDAMARLGVDPAEMWDEHRRFRGMRGVRQLRGFIPLTDGRAESQGESVLRLRWLDLGNTLPRPELQIEVPGPYGETLRLDLGVRKLRSAFEYDGEEWHDRNDEQREHDESRRGYLRDEEGWMIEPVTKANIWGPQRDIEGLLVAKISEARRRFR
jgi:hypothetical protein